MTEVTSKDVADVLNAALLIRKPWTKIGLGGGRMSEIIAAVPHIDQRLVQQIVHKLVQRKHLVELVEVGHGKGSMFRYYRNIYRD